MNESHALDETDAETATRFGREVIPFLDRLFDGAMRMTLQRDTVLPRIHCGRMQLRVLLADLAADRRPSLPRHRSASLQQT